MMSNYLCARSSVRIEQRSPKPLAGGSNPLGRISLFPDKSIHLYVWRGIK